MGVSDTIQKLNPTNIPVYSLDQLAGMSKGTTPSGINPGAITIAPGTDITPPESVLDRLGAALDWVQENWKLSAIAVVAVFILIRD